MTVKNLAGLDFNELLACFLKSFENYYVKMPTDSQYYHDRWTLAKVDFNLSYGMFENEKLVGFIINAIDKRNGVKTAYNAGTGVLPEFRGKKIIKAIYDFAIPDLRKNGITRCTLEVITKNKPALKSYQGVGFSIQKNYKCFQGKIELQQNGEVTLQEMNKNKIDWQALPRQGFYSWENQGASIENGNFKFCFVTNDDKPESFFVINPVTGYLPQFDIINNENKGWDRLFQGIKQVSENIKINNIDDRLTSKINYVNSIGLVNYVDQYEMELNI
jgi:GNAT superfamily N-acetyltransferase